MAIARSVSPIVVIAGDVERLRELRKKADNSVYGHEVTLALSNDARASYTIYERDDRPQLPRIGEFVAVEASLQESRDYGASLSYERSAEAALDAILNRLAS